MFAQGFPSLHPSAGPVDTPGAVAAWDTRDAATGAAPLEELDPFGTNPGVRFPGSWEPQPNTGFLETSPVTWRSAVGQQSTGGWLGSAIVATEAGAEFASMSDLMGDTVIGAERAPLRAIPAQGTKPVSEFFVETKGHCIPVPQVPPEHHRLYRAFTPKGDYHTLDVALFWYNIRQNVRERVAAYVKGSADPT